MKVLLPDKVKVPAPSLVSVTPEPDKPEAKVTSCPWVSILTVPLAALVERIVKRESLEDLQAATRALDRVLLWGRYVIHFWYQDKAWIAHWNRFGRPETASRFGVGDFPTTWWIDPAKQAAPGR